jgi:AcrR family transcriptional regulator
LKAARARGRIGGRPKVLSPKQVRQARALLSDPKVTIREVCERMKVSRTTLYNYVGAVVPVRKSE